MLIVSGRLFRAAVMGCACGGDTMRPLLLAIAAVLILLAYLAVSAPQPQEPVNATMIKAKSKSR